MKRFLVIVMLILVVCLSGCGPGPHKPASDKLIGAWMDQTGERYVFSVKGEVTRMKAGRDLEMLKGLYKVPDEKNMEITWTNASQGGAKHLEAEMTFSVDNNKMTWRRSDGVFSTFDRDD